MAKAGVCVVVLSSTLVGCTTMVDVVHQRAVNELGCDSVAVGELGGQTFTAYGCGRTATYTCARDRYNGVACVHDESGEQRVTANAPPPVTSQPLDRSPPTGVAGFVFGSAQNDAKATCEAAGHAFTAASASQAECNGFAVELGQAGVTHLRYCSGKLCGGTMTIERNGETLEQSVVRWKQGLIDKYGTQTENRTRLPLNCPDLAACVATGATVSLLWSWRSRESVELRVGECRSPDACRVELVYNASVQAVNGL